MEVAGRFCPPLFHAQNALLLLAFRPLESLWRLSNFPVIFGSVSPINLDQMLARLDAKIQGEYIYLVSSRIPKDVHVFATVAEDEGTTCVIAREDAEAAGYQITDIYTRITLRVESSPQAVGLTSAVAQALSARSMPCNVIAGFYHDHIFVPKRMTDDAIELLRDLSKQAQGWL